MKLPKGASPVRARQGRLRGLRATLDRAPSDAPTEVWLASADVTRLSYELDGMTALGPKHPDRIHVEAELEQARRTLAAAIEEATRALDGEIARLDGAHTVLAQPDPTISRRAELAARARHLRRAFELCSAR